MKCEDRHFPSEADEIVIVPICRFAPLLRVELIPELSMDVCKKAAHVLFPPLTVCIERCHSFIEEKQISKEKVEERNCFKTNTIICMKMCFVTIFWSCLKPTGIKKIDHTNLQYLLMYGKCQHHSWEGDLWQKKCYSCFFCCCCYYYLGMIHHKLIRFLSASCLRGRRISWLWLSTQKCARQIVASALSVCAYAWAAGFGNIQSGADGVFWMHRG